MDDNGILDFFCSYFVTWVCQAGESIEVLKAANNQLPDDQKITPPTLSGKTADEQRELVKAWAEKTIAQHGPLLRQHIKLTIDGGFTTPQRFYNFVVDHPELFTQEMMIVSPPAEMEMDTLT